MDMHVVEAREKEGKLLKECWLKHKSLTGESQTAFCARLSLDQGQLQGWFRGKQPIPEKALLKMSAELSINPALIRPSIREKALSIVRLTQPGEAEDILFRLNRLEGSQLQELCSFLDYLESKNSDH